MVALEEHRSLLTTIAACRAALLRPRTLSPGRGAPSRADFGVCVAYGSRSDDPSALIARYSIAILDTGAFPRAPVGAFIAPKKGAKPVLQERFGYFGLAVNTENPAYAKLVAELKKEKVLLTDRGGEPVVDPLGPKSLMVDLRNEHARRIMIKHAVEISRAPGYTGVFIDALDSSIALENGNPRDYTGLVRGTVKFFEELGAELAKKVNERTGPDGKTKFAPGMMINGGFADFTADKEFDPLKAMIAPCRGRILIESQLLDDKGSPRPEPLGFSKRRIDDAAGAAKAAGVALHISFVEPRARDPKELKAFIADAEKCRALAEALCAEAAEKSGVSVTGSVHLAHGNYVAPGPSLRAIEPLRFQKK